MAQIDLTQGACKRFKSIAHHEIEDSAFHPVVQALTVRKINSTGGTSDRYRVILSDGDFFMQGMLSSQTVPMVEEGSLERHAVIRVTNWTPNIVQGRLLIIILGLEIVAPASSVPERIGDPQNIDKADEAGGDAPSAATKPAPVKHESGTPPAAGRYNNTTSSAAASNNRTTSAALPPDMASIPLYPIEGLSPYQNKWMIKARVTTKSDIKHWSNARGEGKLFSCNFLDESGEIKATGFNDAVDRFYNMLKEGHVYYVTKARVNIAKKKFSNLSNEYEIAFENGTQIHECLDESATEVPDIKYSFVSLDHLDGVEPKQTCDVVGIVDGVGDVSEIISKASQKPVTKRELTLVDQTGMSVRLTLWGKTAETYGTPAGQQGCLPEQKPVIAFKGVSVSDFGGRSLSMFSSSTMSVNPDIPEAHGLRGWFDAEGNKMGGQFKSYNAAGLGGIGSAAAGGAMDARERKVIQQAKDENLGMGEKQDYFNFKGTVMFIKSDNLSYTACPKDGCNKKVTLESDGTWRCEKCEMSYPAPEHRYIISANVQDYTGSIWVNGFNEIGLQLIGKSANELAQLKADGDDGAVSSILEAANGTTWMFNIRARQETFNDTPRVRYNISRMTPVDFVSEGNMLAEEIKKAL